MSSVYTPDKWVVLRIVTKSGDVVNKVLAGWHGGWAGSDHWQLNSGIKLVDEYTDRFEFHGYSGSTYICYKSRCGFTSLTNTMFGHWKKKGIQMEVLEEYNVRSKH